MPMLLFVRKILKLISLIKKIKLNVIKRKKSNVYLIFRNLKKKFQEKILTTKYI